MTWKPKGKTEFADGVVVEADSADAALRVTQTGTGDVLRVEDSANPDSTPLVVTADGSVGIGTTSPATHLHLQFGGPSSASPGLGGRVFLEGAVGNVWVDMASTTTGAVGLRFGDSTNISAGRIGYSNSADFLDFYTAATERMRIDSAGLITGSGTSLGAWTAYTPTIGNSWAIGNGTEVGYYCKIGKTVHFVAIITMGSTTTFGSDPMVITVPLNQQNTGLVAAARFSDVSGGAEKFGFCRYNAAGNMAPQFYTGDYVTTTSPFTWASGDAIRLTGTYEAA